MQIRFAVALYSI